MTSRLIRMLISDHCGTDLNGTRQCNFFSGDVMIVKTNNTRRCRDLLISLFCSTKCTISTKLQPRSHFSLLLVHLSFVKTRF